MTETAHDFLENARNFLVFWIIKIDFQTKRLLNSVHLLPESFLSPLQCADRPADVPSPVDSPKVWTDPTERTIGPSAARTAPSTTLAAVIIGRVYLMSGMGPDSAPIVPP